MALFVSAAVVSVQQRPDFNQAAQAAAAAATGQPLMANNMSQQTQYHMQYMPSASVQQVRVCIVKAYYIKILLSTPNLLCYFCQISIIIY